MDGQATPHTGDVFEVELIGAAAGLLGALLVLAKVQKIQGPYRVSTAQVLLKAPTGAGTALIGVLLLQSGALAGLAQQPGSNILGYAALFGFSQQLLTQLVDKQAQQLTQ